MSPTVPDSARRSARSLRHAALAFLLGCAAAQAQNAPPCEAAWEALSDAQPFATLSAGTIRVEDGWCVFDEAFFDVRMHLALDYWVERLAVRGAGVDWMAGRTDEPSTLEVRADGIAMLPPWEDNPLMGYVWRVKARRAPMTASLTLEWDGATKLLDIQRLHFDFQGNSALTLAMTARQAPARTADDLNLPAAPFIPTAIDLEVRTHGLFETFLLDTIAFAFLPLDEDPEVTVPALKEKALFWVRTMPETVLDAQSKAAIGALIAELPNPDGTLNLKVGINPDFGEDGFLRLLTDRDRPDLGRMTAALYNLRISVGWVHEDPE